jgi:hypothetical protein
MLNGRRNASGQLILSSVPDFMFMIWAFRHKHFASGERQSQGGAAVNGFSPRRLLSCSKTPWQHR